MINIPLYAPHDLPRVGETRIEDGQLSMCINPNANYGGGSGPLWAVENQLTQFTVAEHRGYLEGICRKVDPKSKMVTIELTKGTTWGRLVSGSIVKFNHRNGDVPSVLKTTLASTFGLPKSQTHTTVSG
jgi:hypothetical protein